MDTGSRWKWALRGRNSHPSCNPFRLHEAQACPVRFPPQTTLKRSSNWHNNLDGSGLTWTVNLLCSLQEQTSICSAEFQPFCAFPELKQAEPERSRGGAAVGGGRGCELFQGFCRLPTASLRLQVPPLPPSLELMGFTNTTHPLSTAWLEQHWPRP